jgi:O-antigen/teichoic acid export membrane protein
MKADSPDGSIANNYFSSVMRGLSWNTAGVASARAVSVSAKLGLAAFLTPDIFGLIAMAMLTINFFKVLADGGISTALVQQKRSLSTDQIWSTAFWVSLGLGLLFMLLVASPISTLVSAHLGEPALADVMYLLSAMLLLQGITLVPEATLVKDLQFKALALAEVLATLVSCSIAIGMAYSGFGIKALITQHIVFTGLRCVMIFQFSGWVPNLTFDWGQFKTLISFSVFAMGSKLVQFFRSNTDNLAISIILGATSLGIYSIAYTLTETLRAQTAQIISKVMLPIYSDLQDEPEKIAPLFVATAEAMSVVLVPISLLIFVCADPLVQLFLSSEWQRATSPIQILALSGVFFPLFGPSAEVLMALGEARKLFRISVMNLVLVTLPLVITLTKWLGPEGTAIAMVIALVSFRATAFWALQQHIEVPISRIGFAIGPTIMLSGFFISLTLITTEVSSFVIVVAIAASFILLARHTVHKIRKGQKVRGAQYE